MAPALAQVAAGVLAADFLTAALHWFEDTYLPHTDSPGLLGDISRDNDMHHFIPYSITAGSWWDNCKVSCQLLAAAAALLLVAAPRWAWRRRVFLGSAFATMALANLLHRFQHERDCTRPALVTGLQRLGILCSRDQHSVHHHDTGVKYSVVLGFTNAVYDSLGVWRFFELLTSAFGVPPSARKPGVGRYAQLYDPWLADNMARDCPEPLTAEQLRVYSARLARAHREGQLAGGAARSADPRA